MWEDLLIGVAATRSKLQQSIGELFDVAPERIVIVDDFTASAEGMPPDTAVIVQQTTQPGEFPLMLSISLTDEALIQRATGRNAAVTFAGRLSTILQCDVLMSDEDIDPYSMLRVRPSGTVEAVTIDADALDANHYRVIASRPLRDDPRLHDHPPVHVP